MRRNGVLPFCLSPFAFLLACASRRAATRRRRLSWSTSRASVDLPEPETPVTTMQPAERHAEVELLQVVQARLLDGEGRRCAVDGPPRVQRVPQRVPEEAAGDRGRRAHQVVGGARCDDLAAAAAGAGAEVHHVLRAADGVFVVLDHDQRVALGLELLQRVEQDAVVARVQADGGLVEDVGDAAQVGAQLRREPDALRLAARERRRGAVEREVGQPHLAAGKRAGFSARPRCPERFPPLVPRSAKIAEKSALWPIRTCGTGRQSIGPGIVRRARLDSADSRCTKCRESARLRTSRSTRSLRRFAPRRSRRA